MTEPAIKAYHVIFRGRVQGVCFRYETEHFARRLGLCGTVRNVPDGTVELYVQGTQEKIDRLLELLQGPTGPGHVDDIQMEPAAVVAERDDFRIVY